MIKLRIYGEESFEYVNPEQIIRYHQTVKYTNVVLTGGGNINVEERADDIAGVIALSRACTPENPYLHLSLRFREKIEQIMETANAGTVYLEKPMCDIKPIKEYLEEIWKLASDAMDIEPPED